jgi:hypothetical protein
MAMSTSPASSAAPRVAGSMIGRKVIRDNCAGPETGWISEAQL